MGETWNKRTQLYWFHHGIWGHYARESDISSNNNVLARVQTSALLHFSEGNKGNKICLRLEAVRELPWHSYAVEAHNWGALATTTATRTPQNNGINEQKQSFCTCVICFCTFLCRHQQNNVKWPNSSFLGEREHTTVNFTFSFPVLEGRTHKFSFRGYFAHIVQVERIE